MPPIIKIYTTQVVIQLIAHHRHQNPVQRVDQLSSVGEFATCHGYLYQAKQVINLLQSHRSSFRVVLPLHEQMRSSL